MKRISAILTAPPKITDKEYQEMKKLVIPSNKGARKGYEQKMVDKKNADFFIHLKKLKPYYKTKEWEKDYEKQLFNQKFMRQVRYKRPANFVDPFATPPAAEEPKKGSKKQQQPSLSASTPGPISTENGEDLNQEQPSSAKSASHVNRVRAMKQNSMRRSMSNINSSTNAGKSSSRNKKSTTPKSRESEKSRDSNDEGDEYGFDFDQEEDQGGVRVTAYGEEYQGS